MECDKDCMCRVGRAYTGDPIPGYRYDGDGYYTYIGKVDDLGTIGTLNTPGGSELPGKIRQDRGADYGPVDVNHTSIGHIWGGILMQAAQSGRWKAGDPLPAELVTLMMVGVKLSREAFRHKADNIVDGKNYLDFTGELSE